MLKYFFIFISAALSIIFIQGADAAVLYALPEKTTVALGESFNVDVKINTEDISVNAAQATVRFPSNIIELVDFDNSVSAFNFWVEEPLVSNEDGTLQFIGGTTNGVSGQTLQVLKITFKAISAGNAQISVNDAVVTAADGRGTNVLSRIEGTAIKVVPETVLPEVPAVSVPPAVPVEQPEAVIRPPVAVAGLPDQPKLRVPLYPDESRWYNHLGEVIVFWEVPEDVIRVATALDKNPGTSPENIEKELFTGKSFGSLSEGIWYVHVQFRNNVGWGPGAHYKISIDTTPPVPFEAAIDNEVSDNPRPVVSFESFDSLSGIAKALIYADNQEPIESQEKSLALPLQPPGKRTLSVKFLDEAGNSVQDQLEFEILPLQTPIIEFTTRRVSRDEQVFVSGTGLPSAFVDLHIYNEAEQEVGVEMVETDTLGKWAFTLKEVLPLGRYTITAVMRDDRGALSFPSAPEKFSIRPGVIVSLGPLDLGWFEIFIMIVLIAVSGVSFYGWYHLGVKKRREAYAVIIARDVEKMHNLLQENLNKLENNVRNLDKFVNPISKDIDSTMKAESMAFIKRMQEVLEKIRKYVKQEVEGLK